MADRIHGFDWAQTPLGAVGTWPQSLRTTVDIMLASGHAMQLAWGPERTVLYNDVYAPMLGERHPGALGHSFREAWPEIWDEIGPLVERVFAGETVSFEEMPLAMTRHGYPEDTWWDFSYSPVRDETGAVAGLLNIPLDATVRVQARRTEAALRESEERLRIALEAGRMGTYRLDLRTGEQEWSDGQYEIFGLKKGVHAPGRELFTSLVHPEDLHRVEFTTEDLREPGTFLDAEFRITRPDGELRWVTAHALAVFGPDGKPAELIGVNQDVTEQRKLEAAMHSSEERLREFSEASSDILWIRGAHDLQWEYLSPAFHKIYGISRADALRGDNLASWAELIVPEDREDALANIDKVRQGERATFEFRIRRPEDGQIRWLRDTDFPMRDEAGKVVRIGGIGHDLTELKLAEQHQKFVLSELQHRVRNTLAVIRSVARRTIRGSDTVEDYASHLEGRIDAFARVQAAVTRNPAVGVDLATLVAEELRAASAKEGEVFSMEGPDVRLLPKAAETVALAVHELTTNAIKHGALTVPDGRIAIGWTVAEGLLDFTWTESGMHDLPAEPPRKGLGMETLTRTLPYGLKAETTITFRPTGLTCRIVLPIATVVREPA